MKLMILLLGAGLAGYFIYQNAKADPQVTRLDGWESTAKNRRPNMPSPAVGDDTPFYAESERAR